MNGRIRVAALLIDLEGALRSRLLWDADEPSPHKSHTSRPGRATAAPSAKPPPTPRVPNTPGSSQDSG